MWVNLCNSFQDNLSADKYSSAELDEFYSRLDKYEKGEMPVFSVGEAHQFVRNTWRNLHIGAITSNKGL